MPGRKFNLFEHYQVVGKEDEEFASRIPKTTVGRFLYEQIQTFDPDKVAEICVFSKKQLTFGQLLQKSQTLSISLLRLGCQPNDIVLACFGNSYIFTSIMLACFWSGTVCLPMNPFYSQEDFKFLLNNFRPRLIISTKESLSKLQEVTKHLNIYPTYVLMDADDNFNFQESGILNFYDLWLHSYPEEVDFQPLDLPESVLDDHCTLIICSSGSSGLPKGVRHTDSSLMFAIFAIQSCNQFFLKLDIMLMNSGGFWISGIILRLSFLNTGFTSIVAAQYNIEEFFNIIEQYKVTRTFLSPSLVNAIVKFNTADYDLSSLRLISFGGAAMSESLIKIAEENFGIPFRNCYGMTEAILITQPYYNEPTGLPKSVGKCIPGVKAKVISLEDGISLPPNELGELCIISPSIMQGYHNNPTATREAIDEQKWFHTGDVAYYDENGWFFIVDRIKELIKYKGFHVAGTEIESVLIKHPDVAEVCVIGIPHDTDWEHAKGFVVLLPGATATETDLIQFVKDRMPEYKQLHGGVQFIKEFPKTTTGKIKRPDLRKLSTNN